MELGFGKEKFGLSWISIYVKFEFWIGGKGEERRGGKRDKEGKPKTRLGLRSVRTSSLKTGV